MSDGRSYSVLTAFSVITLPMCMPINRSTLEAELQGVLKGNQHMNGQNCRSICRSFSLGGEIESRLAYTQESEGQNLPERPFASWRNQERVGL